MLNLKQEIKANNSMKQQSQIKKISQYV